MTGVQTCALRSKAAISTLDPKPRLMSPPLLPSTLGSYYRLMVFIFQHRQSPNRSWNCRGVEAFQVRFVPSFVVITLWSSLLQIHIHCFSNTTDFAARLFAHFPNFTSHHRYGTDSFLPLPLSPCLHRCNNLEDNVSAAAKCSLSFPPPALCYWLP